MEFFHLLDNVGGIKIKVAERNNLARMLSSCLSHYFPRRKWSEPQIFSRSLTKPGTVTSKCTCMSTMRSAVGEASGVCPVVVASAVFALALDERELTATVLA